MGSGGNDSGSEVRDLERSLSEWLRRVAATSATGRRLQVGDVLNETYEIKELIARGGMGEIYLALHNRLRRRCVVKVPRQLPRIADDDLAQLLELEARFLARLQHDNILAVEDYDLWLGCPYIVQEYLQGETLLDLLRRDGPLAAERALELMTPLLRGLAHAHGRGVCHRDLKPENVFIRQDGRVKLLDFGLAGAQRSLVTVSTMFLSLLSVESRLDQLGGTQGYMSPEQWAGEGQLQADIWAAGVTLFQLLTRRLPLGTATLFPDQPRSIPRLTDWQPDLPSALQGVVDRAMAWRPEDRFASADDFLDALEGALVQSALVSGLAPTVDQRPPPLAVSDDAASLRNRQQLIRQLRGQLARLPPTIFAELVLALQARANGFDCEEGPARCAVSLLEWADSPNGCSLEGLRQALDQTLAPGQDEKG